MSILKKLIALIALTISALVAHAQTTQEVIGEQFGFGWGSWSWPSSPNPVIISSAQSFKGLQSVQMNYNAAWSGFSPGGNSGPFNTTGYKSLTFAVYNASNSHQLYLRATRSDGVQTDPSIFLSDYSPTNTIPQGQWTWIRIPIADLKLGANPQISYFAIQSANVGQAYFDEMRFEQHLTLYEGVQGIAGPSVQRFNWGSTVTTPSSVGDYWLSVNVTQAWGGLQFYVVNKNTGTMQVSDFTHLTVHFMKTVTGQVVNARLVGDANVVLGSVNLESFVPGGVATLNTWYRVVVPLSAFGVSSGNLTGVVLDANVAGIFQIDDVKFVNQNFLMNLIFPLVFGYADGAYTSQKINTVLDHHMTAPYTDKDGNILSFTGETFLSNATYPSSGNQQCYPKSGGVAWSAFLANIYKGTIGSGALNCVTNVALNYEAHPGYDYVASSVPVRAAASGVVVSANGGCVPKGISEGCAAWGAVGIDHGNGYITQYLHMNTISVSPGQVVTEGQQVGISGNKSPPTKPIPYHFHFEVLKVRPSYVNDYQPGSYATVDPYGFDSSGGAIDFLANQNGVPSVCLWKSGCRFQ